MIDARLMHMILITHHSFLLDCDHSRILAWFFALNFSSLLVQLHPLFNKGVLLRFLLARTRAVTQKIRSSSPMEFDMCARRRAMADYDATLKVRCGKHFDSTCFGAQTRNFGSRPYPNHRPLTAPIFPRL
jgi:hypothetical protein